jgi:hypothetical protein
VNVAHAELPIGMCAQEVGPLLTGDLLRGVTNQNDDVRLILRHDVEIPDLYNVAMLDMIGPHTANRIPVPIDRKSAARLCGDGQRFLCWVRKRPRLLPVLAVRGLREPINTMLPAISRRS